MELLLLLLAERCRRGERLPLLRDKGGLALLQCRMQLLLVCLRAQCMGRSCLLLLLLRQVLS